MKDFVNELRERWGEMWEQFDDQLLAAVAIAVITGVLGIVFAYCEGRARKAAIA